jgi:putative transcriptional regulator
MQSLQHHLLIAMPSLNESFFEKSVVYLCEHNTQGAMGFVINQSIGFNIEELFIRLELPVKEHQSLFQQQVLVGGPVMPDRGFVLHTTNEVSWSDTQIIAPNLSMTTSNDVLQALGSYKSPQQYLITLGYAGWAPEQLEQEIAANAWLTLQADQQILFETPLQNRWQEALKRIGFDPSKLSNDIGHA